MLAAGLTLIFSMMGVLNFARKFCMLGAYMAYQISTWIGFWGSPDHRAGGTVLCWRVGRTLGFAARPQVGSPSRSCCSRSVCRTSSSSWCRSSGGVHLWRIEFPRARQAGRWQRLFDIPFLSTDVHDGDRDQHADGDLAAIGRTRIGLVIQAALAAILIRSRRSVVTCRGYSCWCSAVVVRLPDSREVVGGNAFRSSLRWRVRWVRSCLS